MYWSKSLLQLTSDSYPASFPPRFIFSLWRKPNTSKRKQINKQNRRVHFGLASCFWLQGLTWSVIGAGHCHSVKENWFSLSRHLLQMASSLGMGPPPFSMLGFCQVSTCAGLVCADTDSEFICVFAMLCVENGVPWSRLPTCTLTVFPPTEPWVQGCGKIIPFRAGFLWKINRLKNLEFL